MTSDTRAVQDLRNKRVTVMGLGLFGGGVSVTRFLVRQGARVTVTDTKQADQLQESIRALRGVSVTYHLGGHQERDFRDADLVVVNPAVKKTNEFLRVAEGHGVPMDTEMNFFFRLCRAPIVGITGSNGKSTTTALAGAMLEKGKAKVWVGGNIGRSLLLEVEKIRPEHIVVLELSSFQLQDLGPTGLSPHVSAILNISPNHLDHHGSLRPYISAKENIFANQGPSDYAILNYEDPRCRRMQNKPRSRVLFFGRDIGERDGCVIRRGRFVLRLDGREEAICETSRLRLPGAHNLCNAAAALLAAAVAGAPRRAIPSALSRFRALEHRLEAVRTLRGVRYINDSVATTPESAIAALKTFREPIVLIAGGHDKELPLGEFASVAAAHTKTVVLIGQTAPKLSRLIKMHRTGERPALVGVETFEDAFRAASEAASPGDVVLLSPACASYGMFRNYAERGETFRKLVKALR